MDIKALNQMCADCTRLGKGCCGTTCQTWTACIDKESPQRMYELYTASYSDGERWVYGETLQHIYASRQDGEPLIVRPVIWLHFVKQSGAYIVDYIGVPGGYTLAQFSSFSAAKAYCDKVSALTVQQFKRMLTGQVVAP